jgi:hypothetical protein
VDASFSPTGEEASETVKPRVKGKRKDIPIEIEGRYIRILPGCFARAGCSTPPSGVFCTGGAFHAYSRGVSRPRGVLHSVPGCIALPGCFKPEGCNTLRAIQRPRGVSYDGVCNSDGVKHAGRAYTPPVRTPPSVRFQLTVSGSYAPLGSYHLAVFGVKPTDDVLRS